MRGITFACSDGFVSKMKRARIKAGIPSLSELSRNAVTSYWNKMCTGFVYSNYANLEAVYSYQCKNNVMCVMVDDNMADEIADFCKKHGHSKASFIRESIMFYLSELDRIDDDDSYKNYDFIDYMNDIFKFNITLVHEGHIKTSKLLSMRKSFRNSDRLSKEECDILTRYVRMLIKSKERDI